MFGPWRFRKKLPEAKSSRVAPYFEDFLSYRFRVSSLSATLDMSLGVKMSVKQVGRLHVKQHEQSIGKQQWAAVKLTSLGHEPVVLLSPSPSACQQERDRIWGRFELGMQGEPPPLKSSPFLFCRWPAISFPDRRLVFVIAFDGHLRAFAMLGCMSAKGGSHISWLWSDMLDIEDSEYRVPHTETTIDGACLQVNLA